MADPQFDPIKPGRVRYVKLGEGGAWEQDCFARGVLRMGFGSDEDRGYALCRAGDWDGFASMWREEGKTAGVATRFANETKLFFEDDGSTLWITFSGQKLLWTMLVPGVVPSRTFDEDSTTRPVRDCWRDHDINGAPLVKGNLAGDLVSLASYRGTSCDVARPDYVVRRINGQRLSDVETAESLLNKLREVGLNLIRLLQPADFELLVDLLFTQSGWRRIGIVGGTQKTLDLDIVLPSTGERAMVQVKSHTTSAELRTYIEALTPDGPHQRLFYAYHSGEAISDDHRVSVLGPRRLADMTIEAGLLRWVMEKVG
jgi:hypothetical protein